LDCVLPSYEAMYSGRYHKLEYYRDICNNKNNIVLLLLYYYYYYNKRVIVVSFSLLKAISRLNFSKSCYSIAKFISILHAK